MLVNAVSATQRLPSFFLFPPSGQIPSSVGVTLRTTDKIVWANEFERKLLENDFNLFGQRRFALPDLGSCSAACMCSASSFTAIELTCLIESISTNNPRIEWKKIKNGIPSYVYFQNKIAGKLSLSLSISRPQNFKAASQDSKLRRMNGTLKELGSEFCFLLCEVTLCIWMSDCKVFLPPLSLWRGLGAESSAQRAGQHSDLQRHSLRHRRVPLRGGRHRRSKGLWWDTY